MFMLFQILAVGVSIPLINSSTLAIYVKELEFLGRVYPA